MFCFIFNELPKWSEWQVVKKPATGLVNPFRVVRILDMPNYFSSNNAYQNNNIPFWKIYNNLRNYDKYCDTICSMWYVCNGYYA